MGAVAVRLRPLSCPGRRDRYHPCSRRIVNSSAALLVLPARLLAGLAEVRQGFNTRQQSTQ